MELQTLALFYLCALSTRCVAPFHANSKQKIAGPVASSELKHGECEETGSNELEVELWQILSGLQGMHKGAL